MRYELLGPMRLVDGTGTSAISARKVETVLAVLLIRSDQVVSFDRLMAEIWGDGLPRRATAGLHVYVSQLRKFLRRPGRTDSPVATRVSGYILHKGVDEIDFHVFLQLMNQGRAHLRECRHAEAIACFDDALNLWRGPVLGGLRSGPIVDGFVTWLTESRLECMELMIDAQLQLGRHRELVGRLYSLVAENPLRETFYRQLMLALYRSERQADALKVYQTARYTLSQELGLEPCRALQDLQRAILAGDRGLDACAI
ncbi:AfsR/SARP family transcriptional regulator [Actinomadura chibensis]|uniref:AfsR/SARP family transcriptional regulator n=1 Tax=Actinomadura chibensis TaxID=392828 RepID=A0A5D0NM95_9ACTN|nr:AfsR/SARP family transcriptional regulator [Actinomadura chibensis]TYB45388.1 AfsR/SARP family transcriptional regulator [Actinomadura chibensis]